MSGLVSSLRARPGVVRLGTNGSLADMISVRVQVPEVWDVLRVEAAKSATIHEVKRRALGELMPDEGDVDGFVVKFRGHEVLDEGASLDAAGMRDGSTLLITSRRRRPVK
ncbi:MAG TPA: hypothetical protein VJ717_06530 [Gemmatimonadaceae bacterium]|nr:hypothetical protein [Gemmatimonadaceae bacterium]